MLESLPDLAAPLPWLPGTAFGAYQRTRAVVVVPDRLGLERQPDGSPALLLTLLRGGGGPGTIGGRLEIGFAVDADLGAVGAALTAQGGGATVAFAEFEGGVMEVGGRLGSVGPAALVPATIVEPALLNGARAVVELSPQAATFIARLLEDATLPLLAALRLTVRGVAPRLPLALELDPRRIASRLAERFGEAAEVAFDELAAGLDALLAGADVAVTGDPAAVDAGLRARTIALRLKDRVASPAPAASARYRLRRPAEVPQGRELVDLAVPTAVTFDQLLSLDLVAAARALAGGGLDRIVRRIDLSPLATGHQRVSFTANLPERVAGLLAVLADLRIPAAPPARPQPVVTSVSLPPPERSAVSEIVLAPGEQLDGEVRLRAVVLDEGGPAELSGPWHPATTTALLLGPGLFPVPLTLVRASAALTSLATAEVVTASGRVAARLDAAAPVTAVPRPRPDEPLLVVLRPLGAGRTIEVPLEARQRLDLDPATLPGFGAHRARITARTAPGQPPLLVEWRPDGDSGDPPRSARLGPDQPAAEIRWIASSPFRPGVVWRVTRDGDPGPWSAPVLPTDDLVIAIDGETPMGDTADSVVIAGIEFSPDPDDSTLWTYLPPGPLLERAPDGAAAIGLVEAGSVSFLQLTTRIDVPETARTGLLAELRRLRSPGPAAIRALPVIVRRVALEARQPGGAWSALAQGGSSGTAPWTTALSVMLTPEQADAVKAALDGTRERVRLVAELTVPAAPAVARERVSATEVQVTTETRAVGVEVRSDSAVRTRSDSAVAPAAAERVVERARDLADLLEPP